jgi:hypothetical protein
MLDVPSKTQKLHLVSKSSTRTTGDMPTWRTLEHNQEEVDDATQDGASHQYPYTPDVTSFHCDPKIEISDGELEEAVGYHVKDLTQVPELF